VAGEDGLRIIFQQFGRRHWKENWPLLDLRRFKRSRAKRAALHP
jgi:hypothetical protein